MKLSVDRRKKKVREFKMNIGGCSHLAEQLLGLGTLVDFNAEMDAVLVSIDLEVPRR